MNLISRILVVTVSFCLCSCKPENNQEPVPDPIQAIFSNLNLDFEKRHPYAPSLPAAWGVNGDGFTFVLDNAEKHKGKWLDWEKIHTVQARFTG